MFKSYADLVAKPTIVIMGAGASRDYGFPLWGELKQIILNYCDNNPFSKVIEAPTLLEISKAAESVTETSSIDSVVTEFGEDAYQGFQAILGLAILEAEAADLEKSSTGWIETFRSKLARTIISLENKSLDDAIKAMINLRFFSLNYDRTFQHRFVEPFFDDIQQGFSKGNARKIKERRTDGLIQRSAIGTFNLFQPHGTFGQSRASGQLGLNQVVQQPANHDGLRVINYGDVAAYRKLILSGWRPNAKVVDDFDRNDPSNHPTYRNCNGLIKGRRVFLAGLSEAGITNSRFIFKEADSVGTNLPTSQLGEKTKAFIGPRLVENSKFDYLQPFFDGLPL